MWKVPPSALTCRPAPSASYTYTYTNTDTNTNTNIYTKYTKIYIHIHIHTHTHTHISIYIHIHIYTYTHIHIYTYIYMSIYIYIYIYTFTYVHTWWNSARRVAQRSDVKHSGARDHTCSLDTCVCSAAICELNVVLPPPSSICSSLRTTEFSLRVPVRTWAGARDNTWFRRNSWTDFSVCCGSRR